MSMFFFYLTTFYRLWQKVVRFFVQFLGEFPYEIFWPLPSYELDQENVPGHKFGIKTLILI